MRQDKKNLKISSSQITVALVCHQEKESLRFVLEDLKRQSAFSQIGEVLLFQNGSCETTRETAQYFLKRLPLKILSHSGNNLGLARAELVKQAQYEWIAWTDCDCRLPENWLKSLISNWSKIKRKNVLAIGGPNRLPEKYLWQKAANLSFNFAIGHGWSPQAWIPKQAVQTYHIPTTNGLFLKQAILQAGNFSPERPFTGEDLDLGHQLKKQGQMLLFPKPVIINSYADTYWENLNRFFTFGKAQAQRKSPLFYFSLPFIPVMLVCVILSFFWSFFLLAPAGYLSLLIFYSFFAFLKTRQKISFFLFFFWLGQHTCYSLGAVAGLLKNLLKK